MRDGGRIGEGASRLPLKRTIRIISRNENDDSGILSSPPPLYHEITGRHNYTIDSRGGGEEGGRRQGFVEWFVITFQLARGGYLR